MWSKSIIISLLSLNHAVNSFLIKEGKELRVWARLFMEGQESIGNKNFTNTFQGKIVEAVGQMRSRFLSDELRNEFKAKAQHMRDVKSGRAIPPSVGKSGEDPVMGFNRFYVPLNLQAIWGYGCWCHFGDDLMVGAGQPVNLLDGYCKSMQLCMRCAVMDGDNCPDENNQNIETTCDPKSQSYTAEFTKHTDDKAIYADCTDSNPDSKCAANTCCCEMKFIAQLLSLLTNENEPFDSSYQHAQGFDWHASCKSSGGGNGGNTVERDCCGEYPNRVIYNKNDIQCCAEDNNLFNPMSHVCCVNGVGVQELGMCP